MHDDWCNLTGERKKTLTWEILNIIGTVAFAISGAIIAMEEKYDIFGVYILGFTTAFGGGTIRNLLIGLPMEMIWQQERLFIVCFVAITLILILPTFWLEYWRRWGMFFDAIGLAAFAIQGAISAQDANASLSAILVAATLTGVGGGALRDILAGRKPMIFQKEIYALWATLIGLMIGLGYVNNPVTITILFVAIVVLRMLSVRYNWTLPRIRLG